MLWCSTSGWGISNFPCYYSLNIVSAHTGICVCAVYVTATECLLESLTGRLLFEVLRLSQRLQRKRHLGDTEKTSSLRINISIHNPDYYNKKGLNGFRTRRSKINRLNMKWLAPPLTSLLTLNAWHTENHGYRSYVTICTGCIKSALYFVLLNEIGTAINVKQMGWVLHSHQWLAYLLLLNVCFLVLVSEELGGEVSWFAIGWDSLSALNLLFCDWLCVRERRSVVALSGVRLFWLAHSRTVRAKLELRYTWFSNTQVTNPAS